MTSLHFAARGIVDKFGGGGSKGGGGGGGGIREQMALFDVFKGDKAFLPDIDEHGGLGATKSDSKFFTGSLWPTTGVFL